MNVLTHSDPIALWQDVIKGAEQRSSIKLNQPLENYLVSLMMRYTDKPELAKQVLATAFLEAQQHKTQQRQLLLQIVGDQCLLYAGLFPRKADKMQVKINYFVDLGRSAYSGISHVGNDLFSTLALQFVVLMDVLQSIRHSSDLLPLEAYEQWQLVGSQHALRILSTYTKGTPFKS